MLGGTIQAIITAINNPNASSCDIGKAFIGGAIGGGIGALSAERWKIVLDDHKVEQIIKIVAPLNFILSPIGIFIFIRAVTRDIERNIEVPWAGIITIILILASTFVICGVYLYRKLKK